MIKSEIYTHSMPIRPKESPILRSKKILMICIIMATLLKLAYMVYSGTSGVNSIPMYIAVGSNLLILLSGAFLTLKSHRFGIALFFWFSIVFVIGEVVVNVFILLAGSSPNFSFMMQTYCENSGLMTQPYNRLFAVQRLSENLSEMPDYCSLLGEHIAGFLDGGIAISFTSIFFQLVALIPVRKLYNLLTLAARQSGEQIGV